ncbi:MAG: hypothetical protein ACOZIN_09385 [Myxococcota bacterium]
MYKDEVIRRLALLLGGLAAACGSKAPPPPADAGETPVADAGHSDGGILTYYKDAVPVLRARCQSCHTTGGIAPFPLTTYDETFLHKEAIASAVSTRRMPPWLPDESCRELLESRRLAQAEMDTLVGWVNEGARAGDPADARPAPDAGTGLPRVDLTKDIGVDYLPTPSAQGDDYRCFVIDPGLTTDQDIVGMDLVPGSREMVHHAILFSAPMADAVAKDDGEAGPGFTCYGSGGVPNIEMVGGWVPGMPPTQAPAGTGVKLRAGSALVLQLHYNTANGIFVDRTQVKLQLARTPVRQAWLLPLVHDTFAVPPNATDFSSTLSFQVPFNATLYGAVPHMHTKGKSVRVARGNTCLIDVPAWDFDWQQLYYFKDPVVVFSGQTVSLTCTWNNPENREVRWGEGTSDEMCLVFFYLTL